MPDVITLPQLLDMSLGTPELGAVNFNQLHKLLMEIINRLDAAGHPVAISPSAPIDSKREVKSAAAGNYPKSSYNNLQDKVNKIERDISHMSTALPDTKDMISKVKSNTPLTDLWQHMQVNKRVESNEDGIKTAMELIQQLIKDMAELKDENAALRNKLDKIDMDEINKQLKKLDELRDKMNAMSALTDKLKDMDAFKDQLDALQDYKTGYHASPSLSTLQGQTQSQSEEDKTAGLQPPIQMEPHPPVQKKSSTNLHGQSPNQLHDTVESLIARLDGMPPADELVTWPGLQDAINGVKGEFAAYRPSSRARSSAEGPSVTPVPQTTSPARPQSGRTSQLSAGRPKSGKSGTAKTGGSDGPSLDLVGILEKLGTVDRRHEELKKRVDELEIDMNNKADKDDVSGKLPDDLLERIEGMSNKLDELGDLREKLGELDILLSDIPTKQDTRAPILGDKNRQSSLFSINESRPVEKPSTSSSLITRQFDRAPSPAPPLPPRLYGSSVLDGLEGVRKGKLDKASAQKVGRGQQDPNSSRRPVKDSGHRDAAGPNREASQKPTASGRELASSGRGASVKDIPPRYRKERDESHTKQLGRPTKTGSKSYKARSNAQQPSRDQFDGSDNSVNDQGGSRDELNEAAEKESYNDDGDDVGSTQSLGRKERGSRVTPLLTDPKSLPTGSGTHVRTEISVQPPSADTSPKEDGLESEQVAPIPDMEWDTEADLPGSISSGTSAVSELPGEISEHEFPVEAQSSEPKRKTSKTKQRGDVQNRVSQPLISADGHTKPIVSKSKEKSRGGDGSGRRRPKATVDQFNDRQRHQPRSSFEDDRFGRSGTVGSQHSDTVSQGNMSRRQSPQPSSANHRSYNRKAQRGKAAWDSAQDIERRHSKHASPSVPLKTNVAASEDMAPCTSLAGVPTTARGRSRTSQQDAVRTISRWPVPITPSRFGHTLREIIHSDYMPEIGDLKIRISTLEDELDVLKKKPPPVKEKEFPEQKQQIIQYLATDDDEKIAEMMRSYNEQFSDLHAHLDDIDDALNDFIFSVGDADSIKRAQKAMTDLQEQLEDLQKIVDYLNKENDTKTKEIQKLSEDTVRLDETKADKEYVDAELDAKADKSQIDGKVNRSVFDSTIGDLQKMIDDLLAKLLAYEEAWKKAQAQLEEDIDGKIDRTELDRLKAYLDKKIRELSNKLKNSGGFNPFCEDAAGLKKQLLPFNCLSCDKPVVVSNSNQLSQSIPQAGGLGDAFTANKSARPYTTFELDQIRQHAKSLLNADYVMDYYSMPRAAGGSHTMTYPHKRVTKQAYREMTKEPAEEIPPEVFVPVRDETEIVGADGHVYRGRFDMRGSQDLSLTQEGRPTTPNSRPRTSPGKRPGSGRPGSMSRPRTAVPIRMSAEMSDRPGSAQRPTSARERPVSSMDNRDEGGFADGPPPVVTIETVAELDSQAMQQPPATQNVQA